MMLRGTKPGSGPTLTDEEEESTFEIIDDSNTEQTSDKDESNAIPTGPTELSAATASQKHDNDRWKVHALWLVVLIVAVATTAAFARSPAHSSALPENISTAPSACANAKEHEEAKPIDSCWTEHKFWIAPDTRNAGFYQWEGLIVAVNSDSSAEKVGLKRGDDIISVNGVDARELGDWGIQLLLYKEEGLDRERYDLLDKNAEGFSVVVRRYPDAHKHTLRRMDNVRRHYFRSGKEECNQDAENQLDLCILGFKVAAVFVVAFLAFPSNISEIKKQLSESRYKIGELRREIENITEKNRKAGDKINADNKNDSGREGIGQSSQTIERDTASTSEKERKSIRCEVCRVQVVDEIPISCRIILGFFGVVFAYGVYELGPSFFPSVGMPY